MGVESGVNESDIWCEGGAKQPIAISWGLYLYGAAAGRAGRGCLDFSVRGPRAGTVSPVSRPFCKSVNL